MKVEVNFPLNFDDKQLLLRLLGEDTQQWPPAPDHLEVVKPRDGEPKPKSKPSKSKAKAQSKKSAEAEEPQKTAESTADEASTKESEGQETTDWIKLATNTAVEQLKAKNRTAVANALKLIGVDKVSDIATQEDGKTFYEAVMGDE